MHGSFLNIYTFGYLVHEKSIKQSTKFSRINHDQLQIRQTYYYYPIYLDYVLRELGHLELQSLEKVTPRGLMPNIEALDC